MQPFVAGQGHIQVDAFEPQVATVGGVAEKQLRGGSREVFARPNWPNPDAVAQQ